MPTCNVNTVLSSGAATQAFDPYEGQIALTEEYRDALNGISSSTATLLTDGKDFQACDWRELRICQAQILRQIDGTSPTVNSLLSLGADFQTLSEQQLDGIISQLLCAINGLHTGSGTSTVNSLLSSGKDFQTVGPRELTICIAELLRHILGGSPTVNSLLSDATKSGFLGLTTSQGSTIQIILSPPVGGGGGNFIVDPSGGVLTDPSGGHVIAL